MPNKIITLDYRKCRPGHCSSGCNAAPSCPLKIIKQEEDLGYPMANPALCRGCAKCVNACPLGAISLC